jgi:uncharacterized RDD family membrane protein YckC
MAVEKLARGGNTASRAGWFAATAACTTLALLLAANAADDRSLTSGWPAAAFFIGFVGIPGAISVGVARFRFTRIACFVVMTGVGFWAGWSMGSSDDAQAGLAALLVPFVGIPLAGAVLVGEGVAVRRAGVPDPDPIDMREERAALQERLGALLVDLVLATAVLVVPLTMLSHRGQEVMAAVLGFAAGIGYLAGSWAVRGATVGQALLRLRVVGKHGTNLGPVRAAVRAVLLIVEVLGTATLLLIPLTGVEIALAAASSGRTLVDRLTGTAVLARGSRATAPVKPSTP